MAQLTPELLAEIVRHRLGLPDSSTSIRFQFLIPEALKLTARKIAANQFLRPLLLSNPDQAKADLSLAANGNDGTVDLATLYADHQLLLEYIDCGEIFLENENYPLQKMSAQRAGLPQQLSRSYRYYFIRGNTLTVKDATVGEVSFAVPRFPATLADLPDSEEIQALFIAKLLELVVGQDSAQDGER